MNRVNPLQVKVNLASESERPILRNLMELYQYDFSEYDDADIGPMGMYDYPYLDHYWVEDGRFPYLLRVGGNLAGFALVSRFNYLTGQKDAWVMSEFFILRKYRRQGLGEQVARWIFERFPGAWQVSQISQNQAAILFWRTVIARYTNNNFEEYVLDNENWHGPIQAFVSIPPKAPTRQEITAT